MHSIQHSFSKKRVLHYDHYDRFNHYNMSFEHPAPPPPHNNAYNHAAGPSARRSFMPSLSNDPEQATPPPLTGDPTFDILDWHPAYQSCQRFFLDHAQHEPATQALCALINIRLPFQYIANPIDSSTPPNASGAAPPPNSAHSYHYPRAGASPPNRGRGSPHREPPVFVSLIPYVKRLVVTGFDKPAILHGLFGDDYRRGVMPHLDCERRNYLFAAKHGGWSCKKQYDVGTAMGGDESVPFMKPLEEAKVEELTGAEKAWSGWLAMEDWMVGPRAPKNEEENHAVSRHREHSEGEHRVNGATELLPNGVSEAFESAEPNGNGHGSSPDEGHDTPPE